jgi:hypothetical protein
MDLHQSALEVCEVSDSFKVNFIPIIRIDWIFITLNGCSTTHSWSADAYDLDIISFPSWVFYFSFPNRKNENWRLDAYATTKQSFQLMATSLCNGLYYGCNLICICFWSKAAQPYIYFHSQFHWYVVAILWMVKHMSLHLGTQRE